MSTASKIKNQQQTRNAQNEYIWTYWYFRICHEFHCFHRISNRHSLGVRAGSGSGVTGWSKAMNLMLKTPSNNHIEKTQRYQWAWLQILFSSLYRCIMFDQFYVYLLSDISQYVRTITYRYMRQWQQTTIMRWITRSRRYGHRKTRMLWIQQSKCKILQFPSTSRH